MMASSLSRVNKASVTDLHHSNDIGIPFGPEKCSQKVTKSEKIVRTEGIELPDGNIVDIDDSYKYFGIPQANGNH